MIFYFSGTGNSRWVAENVASSFSDSVTAMSDFFDRGAVSSPVFTVAPNELIGFVFPVHSWGIPPAARKFIENLQINSYNNNLIFGIFTCGDDCANTRKMFLKLIHAKGWTCRHVYSVQMPNTYIVLPGFNVDRKSVEKCKIEKAGLLLPELIQAIRNDKPVDAYIKGSFSFLKTGVIYPLFVRHALNSRPFHSTNACLACGHCANNCPTKNITVSDKPVWGNHCVQCLSCIHRCPTRAIDYGKITQKKGRYYFRYNKI